MDQYFQTLRPLRRVGKLRGVIEVPTFSADCGEPKGCIHTVTSGQQVFADNDGTGWPNQKDVFTFECWVKPDYFAGDEVGTPYRTILSIQSSDPAFNQVWIYTTYSGRVYVNFATVSLGDYAQLDTGYYLSVDEWTHIAVVFDTSVPIIKFYANGMLIASTAVDVSTLLDSTGLAMFGESQIYSLTNLTSWRGRIDEIRFWNVARSDDDILRCYRSPRDTSGVQDVGLIRYVKFSAYPFVDSINGYIYSSDIISAPNAFDDADDYPFRYGGSFIAGRFSLDAGVDFSFVYPIKAPVDANFVPVISWQDDDGNVLRYKLWDLDGFVYNPNFAIYTGERIKDNNAYVEIWNIDGNSTVDNTVAFDIRTSILSVVSSNLDVTPVTNATLTIDTALAEPIPLTNFPLEFTTQLTYS